MTTPRDRHPIGRPEDMPTVGPIGPSGQAYAGGTPHLTIGNVRSELTPSLSWERTDGRLTGKDLETRQALVRLINADPVKQQWLRDYGAALLRSAAAELLLDMHGPAVKIVENRAAEHERGETALW